MYHAASHVGMERWANGVRGITHDEEHWYISQSDRILKMRITGIPTYPTSNLRTGVIPAPLQRLGYNHIGDIAYHQGLIYAPLEGTDPKRTVVYDLELAYEVKPYDIDGTYLWNPID